MTHPATRPTIATPITYRDLVIGTCGFTSNPKHCVAVRVAPDGSLTEVWRIEKSVPHIPSPIIVNDLLFLWDDKGHPLCVHGYPMRSNGHDYGRRRTKWCCHKVCLKPQSDAADSHPCPPTPECPFQTSKHKLGQVVNIVDDSQLAGAEDGDDGDDAGAGSGGNGVKVASSLTSL